MKERRERGGERGSVRQKREERGKVREADELRVRREER